MVGTVKIQMKKTITNKTHPTNSLSKHPIKPISGKNSGGNDEIAVTSPLKVTNVREEL